MRYRSINQILFAICLLILGMVLLLVNIGVISLEIKDLFVVFYPFVIFAYGVSLLIKRLVSKNKGNLFFASFLILFSSLLILDRFGIILFKFLDIWKLWPVLIIVFALSLIFKENRVKIHFSGSLPPDVIDKEALNDNGSGFQKERKKVRGLSIGDVSFKESNWSLEPMELYNSIGDYYMDFSKAFIPEKETPVTVQGWIGDVKMIVPENVPVHIEADINIGDIRIFEHKTDSVNHRSLEFKSPGYDDATRKLKIKVKLKIGSIRIDKV